jgi:drug/metabolite transporter (DMT)-like permease
MSEEAPSLLPAESLRTSIAAQSLQADPSPPATYTLNPGLGIGFAAMGVVVLCWSGFNIVSRIGGKSVLTPYDLAALRFLVAAILLSPMFFKSLGMPGLTIWRRVALASCAGLGYALLVYMGFSLAPAAHAGVLVNGGIPLATTMIGWWVFGLKPTHRAWIALAITGAGIALIGRHSLISENVSLTLLGDLFYFLAACSWGFYGQLVRRWQVNPLAASANINMISLLIFAPIYLLFLPKGIADATSAQIMLQAGYQGVVAGVIAASCYAFATLRIGPTRASLMLALVPPISAIAAVPFLGEALTIETALGAALVTIGAVFGASGGLGIRHTKS